MRFSTLLPLASLCLAPFAAAQGGHEDLREAIRQIVREEIRAAMQDMAKMHAGVAAHGSLSATEQAKEAKATLRWSAEAPAHHEAIVVEGKPMVKVVRLEGGKKGAVATLDDVTHGQPVRVAKTKVVEGRPIEDVVVQVEGHAHGKFQPAEIDVAKIVEGIDIEKLVKQAHGQQGGMFVFQTDGKGAFTMMPQHGHKAVKVEKAGEKAGNACEIECKVECTTEAKHGECCETPKQEECCEAAKKAVAECCEAAKATEECLTEAKKAAEKCEAECAEKCTECVVEVAPVKAEKAKKAKKSKKAKKAKKAAEPEVFELKIG
jgi:hypothetical protein